jgi:hypothetical protein
VPLHHAKVGDGLLPHAKRHPAGMAPNKTLASPPGSPTRSPTHVAPTVLSLRNCALNW